MALEGYALEQKPSHCDHTQHTPPEREGGAFDLEPGFQSPSVCPSLTARCEMVFNQNRPLIGIGLKLSKGTRCIAALSSAQPLWWGGRGEGGSLV